MNQANSSDVGDVVTLDQPVASKSMVFFPSWWARILQLWQKYLPQRLILAGLLFSIALFFDLRHLGRPGIWFDEAFSVELARQPLPLLWHIIFGLEPNMELYYLFLHFWLALTGLFIHPIEFVVRFPSAIFAALQYLRRLSAWTPFHQYAGRPSSSQSLSTKLCTAYLCPADPSL